HLAVGKSASRKLSGFRNTTTWKLSHFRQELFDNGFTTVQMKFGAILPGKTVRPREKEHKSAIDRITISATEQLIGCISRHRHGPDYRFESESNFRTGNAYNGNTGRQTPAR